MLCPARSTLPSPLFSLAMRQGNRLIGALIQPGARNGARQGAQSQRCARIRREEGSWREKDESRDNEERQKKDWKMATRKNTNMIGEQTIKQNQMKDTVRLTDLWVHVANFSSCWRQIAAQSERLGWDQTPRNTTGEVRPAVEADLAGISCLWNTMLSYWACLFVYFSTFIHSSVHYNTPFSLASVSNPSCSLASSAANCTFFFIFPPSVRYFKLICVLCAKWHKDKLFNTQADLTHQLQYSPYSTTHFINNVYLSNACPCYIIQLQMARLCCQKPSCLFNVSVSEFVR